MAVSPKKIPKWPSKHMKRCSTSFVIREIQVETMVSYYCIFIEIGKMEKD